MPPLPALSRHALGTLLVLLPPFSLLAPLAAAPALGLVAALVVLPWLWRGRGPALRALGRDLLHDPVAWLLAALALWGALSLLWSPEPAQGAALLPRVILVGLCGLLLVRLPWAEDAAARRSAGGGLAAGLTLALLWLGIDMGLLDLRITGWLTNKPSDPENAVKRGLSMLALMVWPAALWLGRHRPSAGIALAALFAPAILASEAGAAKLALVVGAVVFALGWLVPRTAFLLSGPVVALAILAQPFVLPSMTAQFELVEQTTGSTRHRLVIWNWVSDHVQDRPLTGWGFNMSRSMPGGDAIDPLTGGEFLPLHPHNAPLQWWLELGVPGALIGAALVVVLSWRAAHRPSSPAGRAAALASLTAALAVSGVGYGAWQLWWLSVLAILAAIVAAVADPRRRKADAPS